jgi:dTDP-4-amino-4,6-dideoxygalactose transaminase
MSDTPITIPLMDLKAQIRALKPQILEGFAEILDNTAFCLGPHVSAFEKDFAAYCQAQHGVAVNSGTSALHLALLALGIKAGDEVITTPYTFVATAWAISYCGATPVFADIDPATFNLDPSAVEKAITPRTKAVVAVHLYGQPADLDPLLAVCNKNGVPLVEDAAQAHGATYKGRRVGSFGAVSAFSFYPSKNLGAAGEGGMALTADATLAAKMRALREHGSVKRYYHETVGFNYRMENVQGLVLRTKLPLLDGWNSRRAEIAALYGELLNGGPVRLPDVGAERTHVYHLYVVRHAQRDSLATHLRAQGIGTALHYPLPLHRQQAYVELNLGDGTFPHAERASAECISLPMFPEMSDTQVRSVAAAVRAWRP